MANWLFHLAHVLFAHRWHWYLSLVVAYLLGIGIFADYETIRSRVNAGQSFIMLPEEFPLWLIVLPFLFWVIGASAYNETKRSNKRPKLIFEKPSVVPMFVGRSKFDGSRMPVTDVRHMDMVSIVVRNNPINRDEGKRQKMPM